jgi:hypothetical protein
MADQKDRRGDVAKGSGAATAGAYVGQRRRQRSARKKAKKPSGLADARLSADETHEAQAREAKRRRRSSQQAPKDS